MPNTTILRHADHYETLTFMPHPTDPNRCRMDVRLIVPPVTSRRRAGAVGEELRHSGEDCDHGGPAAQPVTAGDPPGPGLEAADPRPQRDGQPGLPPTRTTTSWGVHDRTEHPVGTRRRLRHPRRRPDTQGVRALRRPAPVLPGGVEQQPRRALGRDAATPTSTRSTAARRSSPTTRWASRRTWARTSRSSRWRSTRPTTPATAQILTPLFSPARMNALEPQIRSLVTDLIDGFAAAGRVRVHRGVRPAAALAGRSSG